MSHSSPLYSGDDTVGVVVPLFNSADTVGETLASIAAQTYPHLDIVVVDDGSTDHGTRIAEGWSARDQRIRLLRQANAGVAAARNAGAAIANGKYLAFCDADDLWAPKKIELQLNALAASAGRSEYVYCWYAIINAENRVTCLDYRPTAEGQVLQRLFRHDFVGNGSSLMVTRALFEKVGGFASWLRDRDAQGCEDYCFHLQAAELTEFSVVKKFLVGYRFAEGSLSSNTARMRRSHQCIASKFKDKYPAEASELTSGLADTGIWLAGRDLRRRKYQAAAKLLREIDPAVKRRGAKYLVGAALKGLFVPSAMVRAVRRFTLPDFSEFRRMRHPRRGWRMRPRKTCPLLGPLARPFFSKHQAVN
jgi:glycosyltransferase involved in cell wall biosynthesis